MRGRRHSGGATQTARGLCKRCTAATATWPAHRNATAAFSAPRQRAAAARVARAARQQRVVRTWRHGCRASGISQARAEKHPARVTPETGSASTAGTAPPPAALAGQRSPAVPARFRRFCIRPVATRDFHRSPRCRRRKNSSQRPAWRASRSSRSAAAARAQSKEAQKRVAAASFLQALRRRARRRQRAGPGRRACELQARLRERARVQSLDFQPTTPEAGQANPADERRRRSRSLRRARTLSPPRASLSQQRSAGARASCLLAAPRQPRPPSASKTWRRPPWWSAW
jgi:hypothetical protein